MRNESGGNGTGLCMRANFSQPYEVASNTRVRWLMGAFACHVMTTVLLDGWQALLGFAFAIIAAGTLIGIHAIENNAARIEMRNKLETKLLTPTPPQRD